MYAIEQHWLKLILVYFSIIFNVTLFSYLHPGADYTGINLMYREGRGAMARARSVANVTACRAVSNPAWCRIFREIACFSPLNIGTLFRCCVLGQDTLLSHASLDTGVNEYLAGQWWQCVRLVPSAEMAASAVCSKKGVEMVHEWTGPVTRGNMCEAHRALYVRYIRTHHYYLLLLVAELSYLHSLFDWSCYVTLYILFYASVQNWLG